MTDKELLQFMEDTATEINILENTGQFSSGYYEREFVLDKTVYRFACDATAFRRLNIQELNTVGYGYSERHGT